MITDKDYEKLLKIMVKLRMAESQLAELLDELHNVNIVINELLVRKEK